MIQKEIAIARLEERVSNLEGWQKTQNGSLIRLEEKIDKLLYLLLTTFLTAFVSLVLNFVRK